MLEEYVTRIETEDTSTSDIMVEICINMWLNVFFFFNEKDCDFFFLQSLVQFYNEIINNWNKANSLLFILKFEEKVK